MAPFSLATGQNHNQLKPLNSFRVGLSGENLFVVLLMMLHPIQELEPPENPARFKPPPILLRRSMTASIKWKPKSQR